MPIYNLKISCLAFFTAIVVSNITTVFAADVTVSVTGPKGSAAEELGTSILKTLVYTPCISQPLVVSAAATNLAIATAASAAAIADAAVVATALATAEETAAASATIASEAQALGDGGIATQTISDALAALTPAITLATEGLLVQATHIDPLIAQAAVDAAIVLDGQDQLATINATVAATEAEVAAAQAVYDTAISETVNLSGHSIANPFDQLKVTVNATNDVDKNGNFVNDLYFMIVDLMGNNIYLFDRTDIAGTFTPLTVGIYTRGDGTAAKAVDDDKVSGKIFLPKNQFIEADYEEDILGNKIYLDTFGLSQGTWMVIAILADSAFSLEDPRTWAAWDSGVFVMGSPLATQSGTTKDGKCQ